MINTSTEYKKTVLDKRKFNMKGTILLKSGETLQLDSSKVVQGGCKITDSTSKQNEFCIGSSIANKLTLSLNNMYDEYSDYDFTDAVITVFVGLQLENRIEWLKKGVFIAEDPTTTPSVLTLEALDNMSKLDKAYDRGLVFPCNLQVIARYCCDKCGVQLSTMQFPNYGYVVKENPFDDDSNNITYRAILSYCAMLACCYARCNVDGHIEIKWYDVNAFNELIKYDGGIFDQTDEKVYQTGDALDGGNFLDYTSGGAAEGGSFAEDLKFHNIYSLSSLDVSTEDVVITGIKVTATDGVNSAGKKLKGETYLCGAEGYILSISGNPLIRYGKAKEIATYIGGKVVGMRFRPLKANALGDPCWEAGDAAVVTDRKGNLYQCYLTNLTYGIGAYTSFQCDAEPAKRHSVDQYSELSKIVADIKKDSQQELDFYTQYVERMNQLAVNSMGYYQTTDEQDDGSLITYMHDKPLLKDSKIVYKKTIDGFFWSKDGGKTWTGGIDKNGNAVMNVIATIGLQADWINTGRLTAKDKSGAIKFLVDADTGRVEIHPDTFTLGGKTVDEIAKNKADSAVTALDKELTATEVFNRLTNGGKIQGLYIKNGQLYVNASYIASGTLKLGGTQNGNGVLEMLDSNGKSIGHIDNSGAYFEKGVFKGEVQADKGNFSGNISVKNNFKVNGAGFMYAFKPYFIAGISMANNAPVSIEEANYNLIIGYYGNNLTLFDGSEDNSRGLHSCKLWPSGIYSVGDVFAAGSISCTGDISCVGTKSRIAETENYDERMLYCYEMPSPMFGDIGEAMTDEKGVCYIFLEDIFNETVSSNIDYHVFLQKEGEGDIWVAEKSTNYFCVKGTANISFSWEVKIKQREYEYDRLEPSGLKENFNDTDYEFCAARMVERHIENLENSGIYDM